jgi:proteasome accessory factor C
MSAGSRLARLLALVPWLVANDGITMAECAEHFGVSVEQLDEDLWLLVVCGVPGYGPDQLVDIQFWTDGVIHVVDPQTLARPLRLTNEEALTLLVALRMLAQLPGVEDREAVVTAAAKLEAASSIEQAERFVAVRVPVAPEVAQAVDLALSEGREMVITYASASKDEFTTRTIRPRRLLTVDGISYLEAHCMSAEAIRTFRLDRVVSAAAGQVTGAEVEPAAAVDTPMPALPSRTATLRLAPDARWIIDVHRATVTDDDTADGLVEVTLPMHSLDWGVRLVLSLRGSATVVDPPELADEVVSAAQAALAAYPDAVR